MVRLKNTNRKNLRHTQIFYPKKPIKSRYFLSMKKAMKKEWKIMKGFTTGLIAGAALVAGIAVVANPMSKRDVRRIRNCSRRAVRGVRRTMHRLV